LMVKKKAKSLRSLRAKVVQQRGHQLYNEPDPCPNLLFI
jgi:hypothetical protein